MAAEVKNITHCLLRSRNYKYRDIHLPHQIPVIIGRGPKTKIRDRRCSKEQVKITADYKLQKAQVLQLGHNPSEVDGNMLNVQQNVEIFDGSSVNLLKDDLKYTLEFLDHYKPSSRNKHLNSSQNAFEFSKFSDMAISDGFASTSNKESLKRNVEEDNSLSKKMRQDEEDLSDDQMHVKEIESKLGALRDSLSTVNVETVAANNKWEEYDHSKLLMFTSAGVAPKNKVAAFDLDHTIIGTKSGKVFPASMDDWKILCAEIPGKLKKLHEDGYKIIIFTNQKGISRGKTYVPDFKRKIERIVHKLGIPIQVMISTGSGKYRKPNTGMWEYFLQKCNHGVNVDLESSIYVGDAAGRPDNWAPKKKKDFSCADRLFALNIGIKFFTPEEYFLNQKAASYIMPVYDPRHSQALPLAIKCQPLPEENLNADTIISSSPEVIVLVGFPASGKSHFVQNYLLPKGYIHINRDLLGTWQKCVSECSKALTKNQKVVIDNTNPDPESRGRYIECAKQAKVPCRCFLFACTIEQAKHNNVFRQLQAPDDSHLNVNDMVLNSYKSKFKEPSLQEGFTQIVKINFVPKFKNKHDEKLFRRFLIEK